MKKFCADNYVGFLNSFNLFWENLFKADGLTLNLFGAELLA